MKFTKMHGCANDYIYVNLFDEKIDDPSAVSIKVSDRHRGIGSDGLITIGPSDVADFEMHIYNADGSEAQMCGNGIRCVGKYVYDNGLTDKTSITVNTLAGIKYLTLNPDENNRIKTVTVDMGQAILEPAKIPVKYDGARMVNVPVDVAGKTYCMTAVSMGNPHSVVFVDDTASLDLVSMGPAFENHEIFPERVNTEFIQILDRKTVNMRVYERGSAETMACGTGACAATVACVLNGLTDNEITLHLLGGDLVVSYDETTGKVLMTGPAETVCTGDFPL